MYEQLADEDFVLIAAAQDTGGEAVAREWYDAAEATYVTLVDVNHAVSSQYGLVNVPSAVWIDEAGTIRRIDEGTYAKVHKMGEFEFGRDDYVPMLVSWLEQGDASPYVQTRVALADWVSGDDERALADPHFFEEQAEVAAVAGERRPLELRRPGGRPGILGRDRRGEQHRAPRGLEGLHAADRSPAARRRSRARCRCPPRSRPPR